MGLAVRSCEFCGYHPFMLVKFHCQGYDSAVRCIGVSCVVVLVAAR